jgi:signal transduction histidine kinase
MAYRLLINELPVLSGDIIAVCIVALAALIVILSVIVYAIGKIKDNESQKYEFITIIAHKFRTPLTSVKWLATSMIQKETDPYKKQDLDDISKSNQKLIDLTGTLIELTESANAGKASYVFERLSLCALVRSTSDTLKDSFHNKNIFFSVKCPDEDIFVKADRARLEFVIQTILENARNYTPPGRNVEVLVSRQHRKAVVTVVDRGIGIDQNDISRLFSKFYRAQNAKHFDTEGFGVGLYLAKSVTEHHHGKIKVSSEGLDKGSTFSIILPRIR